MGVLVFILGRSGTGKSYSMRDFPKDKLAVVNVQGKILPFKGAGQIEMTSTDTSRDIVNALEDYGRQYKSIVVDDFQYVMANEFMRRSSERGYDKFTEIGRHAWDIANTVRSLPADCIVYVMCHTDRDEDGNEKIKTIGKLLDEKICLEGMSTIVLMTNVTDGVYTFLTQNNGKNTVKSPAGMFPSYAIDNNLHYVDQKIRSYYELGEFLTEAEMAEIDEMAKKDDIPIKDGKKKKRGSRSGKEEQQTSEASEEEKKEEAAGSAGEIHEASSKGAEGNNTESGGSDGAGVSGRTTKRRKKGLKEEQIEAAANNVPDAPEGKDAVPFEETEPVEDKLPKRKSRKKKEEPAMNPPTASTTLYYKHGDEYVVIKEGEVIPNPADGYEGITKEQYEAAVNPPANMETPEGGRRRRRRHTQ